jgi:hypothetical protein
VRRKSSRKKISLAQGYSRFWKAQERLAHVRSNYYRMQARNVRLQGRLFRMMANLWDF